MTLHQIYMALYATFLTNYYGMKLKFTKTTQEKKKLRIAYSLTLLTQLNIKVKVLNQEKIPQDGQFLLLCNHRSVMDSGIVEVTLKESKLYGNWIAKKELYNSFFFGLFVRNGGTILLDRESTQMGSFFKDVKDVVTSGNSIYIFPEGTRNKTEDDLIEFQGGARIIAIKNRLDILPIYIKTNANRVLMDAIKYGNKTQIIEVEVGDIISYKDKTLSLQEHYKKAFNLS